MGEPIVETPTDALWCMLLTGIDHMVIGNTITHKAAGFQSVMHLYPRVVAQSSALRFDRKHYAMGFRGTPSGLTVEVSTAWGPYRHVWTEPHQIGPVLGLLQAADGTKSVGDIMSQVTAGMPVLRPEAVASAMGRMRRIRFIDLVSVPLPPRDQR